MGGPAPHLWRMKLAKGRNQAGTDRPRLPHASFGLETTSPNNGLLNMGPSGFVLVLRINTMRERHNGDNELHVSSDLLG